VMPSDGTTISSGGLRDRISMCDFLSERNRRNALERLPSALRNRVSGNKPPTERSQTKGQEEKQKTGGFRTAGVNSPRGLRALDVLPGL
jgi:hypothetical protein